MYHPKVQEDGTTSCAIIMKLQKYFLFSYNFIDCIPIAIHDVASFGNVVWFCNISSAFHNQQPTINVQVINLSDFLSRKSFPQNYPLELFRIDAFFCFLLSMCQL
jgi:hypothetical protein